MEGKRAKTLDAYIKNYPPKIQVRLRIIKNIVRKVAPRAEEAISYGMPAFKLNGVLIYFSAFKNHIGLYPFPGTMKALQKETKGYKTSKSTIQFQHEEKLPTALITKIVKFRLREKLESNKLK